MALETAPVRLNPSDETIRLGPLAVRFLITGQDATGSVAVFELTVPAAQRLIAPAHSHDHYEETIYGIDGILTWTVDGQPIDVGPGQALCIPRGAVHRFDNAGPLDVKALCDLAGRHRARVFPRRGRDSERGGRRSAGPGQDGRPDAPARAHSGSLDGERTAGRSSGRTGAWG